MAKKKKERSKKKQEKRPAHEVLLEKIGEYYKITDPNLAVRCIVEMLCHLMEEMVIPKEHLVEIIDKLEKIKKLPHYEKFDKIPINCLIEDLQHQRTKLAHEVLLGGIEYWYTRSKIIQGLGVEAIGPYQEVIDSLCRAMENMVLFPKTKEELDHIVSKLREIKKLPHSELLNDRPDRPINSLIKHFLHQKKALSS